MLEQPEPFFTAEKMRKRVYAELSLVLWSPHTTGWCIITIPYFSISFIIAI
jgi:hypothetical protein